MKATVVVDEVGRLVLPKPVREAIGVFGRANLKIEVVSGVAQLSPAEQGKGTVARRRGRTIYSGTLPTDWDSGESVSRMRRSRLKR